MPYRKLPNSTPSVIRTLKTAGSAYLNTPNPADRAITADQFAKLDLTDPTSLLSRFLGEASAVQLAEAAQAPLTSEEAKLAAKLTQIVSHFHQVLDLGVARGVFNTGARSYYGRDITATSIPDLSGYQAVSDAAEAVVNGEAARQKAEGAAYVAMALPSAAEVGTLLGQFNNLDSQSGQAQEATEKQRGVLNTDYPAAQALAVDICDTVEFFYRKTADDATRRVQCQRWGVVYIYDNAGTPTPTPPVPAPAATTPPAK
jgi:hypothetical protein